MGDFKYLDYFDKETKDLENRSDIESKKFMYKWGIFEEIYNVKFEYDKDIVEISCSIKYGEKGYKELWYSMYGGQSRMASNVIGAVENAKDMIAWKAWGDNGAIPDVDHSSDGYIWCSVLQYPEKGGELMIVSDVRHTVTARRKDGTYITRTITIRGKDDLSEGLTDEFYSLMEKLLD